MFHISSLLLSSILCLGVQAGFLQVGEPRPFYNASNIATMLSSDVGSGAQHLRCYDRANQVGIAIDIGNQAVADLSRPPYYFDNRIASCTFNGIYFLYDDYNFNARHSAAVYAETWGDNYRVNLNGFAGKASSVRLTGAPDGYKYDTFNTYAGSYYQGAEQYFYSDAPSVHIDNFGQSLVVTGCNPWTAYEYNNYSGHCACFYPADLMACSPGFFRTPQAMGGMAGRISSVRRGCYCYNNQVFGESLEDQKVNQKLVSESGQEGQVFNA